VLAHLGGDVVVDDEDAAPAGLEGGAAGDDFEGVVHESGDFAGHGLGGRGLPEFHHFVGGAAEEEAVDRVAGVLGEGFEVVLETGDGVTGGFEVAIEADIGEDGEMEQSGMDERLNGCSSIVWIGFRRIKMKQHGFRFLVMMVIFALAFGSSVSTGLAAGSVEKPSALTRISFDSGATSATVSGRMDANGRTRYVLWAGARQLIDVTLSGPEGASIDVRRRNGRASVDGEVESRTSFRGYLPNSGDYIVDVYTGAKGGDYSLFVSIPEKVAFQPNTTSDLQEGSLGAHASHEYILRAARGQILDVSVETDQNAADTDGGNGVQLVIYGVDGSVLKSGMSEGASFRGELPLSQSYIIRLQAGDRAVDYSVNMVVPRRISFVQGAYSGSDNRQVKAHASLYYSVRARQGQTMTVEVDANKPVQLIIYGVDGDVLMSGMGDADNFQGKLSATQDYILVVRAGDKAASYKIVVTIK